MDEAKRIWSHFHVTFLSDDDLPPPEPVVFTTRGAAHDFYDAPLAPPSRVFYIDPAIDPNPPCPFAADDPWAPKPPARYRDSALAARRRAVFVHPGPRICLRCEQDMGTQPVVCVARPGLPAETIHVGCLEADDQVQPAPLHLTAT